MRDMGILGFGTKEAVKEREDASAQDVPTEEGDHDRYSHYVEKDKLTEAMVMGTPVVALCGKVWVPSRDGSKFPVCPDCKEIFGEMSPEGGEGDDE